MFPFQYTFDTRVMPLISTLDIIFKIAVNHYIYLACKIEIYVKEIFETFLSCVW